MSGDLSVSSESKGEVGKCWLFTLLTSIVNVPYPFGSDTSDETLISLTPTLTSKFSTLPWDNVWNLN